MDELIGKTEMNETITKTEIMRLLRVSASTIDRIICERRGNMPRPLIKRSCTNEILFQKVEIMSWLTRNDFKLTRPGTPAKPKPIEIPGILLEFYRNMALVKRAVTIEDIPI